MAANTNEVKAAIHNVTQGSAGTVDTVTFDRAGHALWVYSRSGELTFNVKHPSKATPAAPAALGNDTFCVPAGKDKTFIFEQPIEAVQVVSGASMTYDFELL